MTAEQKSTSDPPEDNSPQKRSKQPTKGSDLFGFGKLMEMLPLQKLSARMAYCMYFDLVLLLFILILRASGTRLNDFPNAWDLRFIVVMSIVIFFVGLGDMCRPRK